MAKQIERSRHGHGTGPGRGRLLARAVLPFKHSGVHADLTALAQGLIEEIITGLARFSYLRVIAQFDFALRQ